MDFMVITWAAPRINSTPLLVLASIHAITTEHGSSPRLSHARSGSAQRVSESIRYVPPSTATAIHFRVVGVPFPLSIWNDPPSPRVRGSHTPRDSCKNIMRSELWAGWNNTLSCPPE